MQGSDDGILIVIPREYYPIEVSLDLGVASTVCALAASGAAPSTSCNAGLLGGSHRESEVLVGFYAPETLAKGLNLAASKAGVGFHTTLTDDGDVIVVVASGLQQMMAFANALFAVFGQPIPDSGAA